MDPMHAGRQLISAPSAAAFTSFSPAIRLYIRALHGRYVV